MRPGLADLCEMTCDSRPPFSTILARKFAVLDVGARDDAADTAAISLDM